MGASGDPARAIVATTCSFDTKYLPRFLIYDGEMLHSTDFAALNHFLPPFDLRQRDWPINRFGKFIQVGPLPFMVSLISRFPSTTGVLAARSLPTRNSVSDQTA